MSYESATPATLDDFVGQDALHLRMEVVAEAALLAQEMLPSLLFVSPYGTGKATMARLIAGRAVLPFHCLTMPVSAPELAFTLANEQGLLLLSEVHAIPPAAMGRLIAFLEGAHPRLSLIGATSHGAVPAPLFSAFDLAPAWEPYSPQDLVQIMGNLLGDLTLPAATVVDLARAAAGNPGQAARLARTAHGLATWNDRPPTATEVLAQAGFAADGLSEAHLLYLETLDVLGGGATPRMLAAVARLHPTVCAELDEFLVTANLVRFGGRGRELTDAGRHRLEEGRAA